MKPKPLSALSSPLLVKSITVCLGLAAAQPSAQAATRTWDGGGGTNVLNLNTNWSGDALPNAVGDIAQWDGTVTGALSLTSNAAWTPTSGNTTGGGTSILVTSTQTSSLTLAGNQNIGLGNVTVQSSAGAVTINPTAQIVFRGGPATITNSSSNVLTFGSSITNWNNGGGTDRTVTFDGSGNTQIDGNFILGGQGNFTTVTKNGVGTLTFNGAQNGGGTGLGNAMASLVVSAGTMKFGNAAQLGIGGGFGAYATNITNNGTLEWGSSANQILSGVISGSGNLVKSSTGALTLSNASLFSGATTINGGTLLVNGTGAINSTTGIAINGSGAKYVHTSSVASTRAITLTQGTLDGTGSVGAVTVGNGTGGVITNGNGGTGTLTLGSLTLTGAGTINFAHSGVSATAPVNVTGALATTPISGQVSVNATVTGTWSSGTTYNLLGYGSYSGSVSDFTLGTVAGLNIRQTAALGLNTSTKFLTLNIGGDTPKWTGGSGNSWNTTATGNWALIVAGTPTTFITGDIVLFDDSATSTVVNIDTANVSPTVTTFNNSSKSYTVSGTGSFGIAAGSVIKNGSNSVTISSANTYNGGTTVNAGTLALSGSGTLGAATGAVTVTGGSVDLGGTSQTTGAVTMSGNGSISNGTLAASSVTGTNTAGTSTISAVISGSGSVTENGAGGVMELSGENTYGGGTSLIAGTLSAGNKSALGSGVITFNSSTPGSVATLQASTDLSGANKLTNGLTVANAQGTAIIGGSNNLEIGGQVILAGGSSRTLTVNNSAATTFSGTNVSLTDTDTASRTATINGSGNLTVSGAIRNNAAGTNTNASALTYTGSGTLTLAGNNSYTGSTTLGSPATLTITGSSSGNGALIVASNGTGFLNLNPSGTILASSLQMNTFGTNINVGSGNVVIGSSGVTSNSNSDFRGFNLNGGVIESGGNVFASGAAVVVAFNGGTLKSGNAAGITLFDSDNTVNVAAGGATLDTTTGNITVGTNASSINVVKFNGTAAGTITLKGGNTFKSAITNTGRLDFQGSTTWDMNGGTSSVGGISGASGTITSGVAGSMTLTTNSSADSTFGGVIQNGSGTVALTKSGTGTQTLSGASISYTGPTTVSDGKLVVNGNITTSVVTVTTGATIGGSGSIGGNLTVASGATLAPGNSAGNLILGNGLTLAGSYAWELGALSTTNPGTDFDIVTVTAGSVDISGALLQLSLGAFAPTAISFWQTDQTWSGIINNTGAGDLAGNFAAIDNSAWSSLGMFTTTNTGNDVNLVWTTAVPEPASGAVLGLAGTLLMLRRRRSLKN